MKYYYSFGTKIDSATIPSDKIPVSVTQIHGDVILKLFNDELYEGVQADAIITNQDIYSLSVITADCVPIVYADTEASILGISHQGWKGTSLQLPKKVVQSMLSHGSKKENIEIHIGPSIGPCCYVVYGDRLHTLKELFPDNCFVHRNGTTYFDLVKANVFLLKNAGIKDEAMHIEHECTSCMEDLYYSYYNGDTGRLQNITYMSHE